MTVLIKWSAKYIPKAVIEHGDAPVWMITWPAAYGLAEYLLLNLNNKGKRVLELGCGTAASGIALSKAGADVVSTDYDHNTLAMARYNGRLNKCSSFKTHFLDWYKPDLEGHFELIVGSDIVYFKKSFMPLISVLKKYISPTGKIILSDQGRPQMKDFLELCVDEGFSYSDKFQMVHLPDLTKRIRIITLTL